MKFSILQIVFFFLINTSAIISQATPDAVIRVSQTTVESLIPLIIPEDIQLTEPAHSSLQIKSVILELQSNPARIKIIGDVTEAEERTLPVSAEIALHISANNATLHLIPRLIDVSPRYDEIPLSEPITLLKAWLLSSTTLLPDSLKRISIPLQTKLDVVAFNKTMRSRQSFGRSTADVVAHVDTAPYTIDLKIEAADVVNNTILVTFSADGSGDENATDFPEGIPQSDSNGLFIGGELLSQLLNRVAGKVSIPFYLENPEGNIDGKSSSTLLGRKEWYVKFQGNRPLSGEILLQNSFNWENHLSFLSEVSIKAEGKVHGHGDPGPGGGCGVRPNISLNGTTDLEGVLNVSVNGGNVEFSAEAIEPTPARLNYHIDRVNFCGFITKGPFRGHFDADVPHKLASTQVQLHLLRGKINDKVIIESTITGSERIADGYWLQFEVEASAYE